MPILSKISHKNTSSTLQQKIALARTEMKDFMFDMIDNGEIYIKNSAPPGIGKSHLTIDLIYYRTMEQFLIIIPNHDMATGSGDLEDMLSQKGIEFKHIYGKTQKYNEIDDYCLRPKDERYYPGCSYEYDPDDPVQLGGYTLDNERGIARCMFYDSCEYKQQFMGVDDTQVIICVLEHAFMFGNRTVIVDESFEQKLLQTNIFSESKLKNYNIKVKYPEKIKCGAEEFTFFNVETPEGINVHNTDSYFVKMFLNSVDQLQAVLIGENKYGDLLYKLFGHRINYLPDYDRIIFNCATTPLPLAEKIIKSNWEWKEFKSTIFKTDELSNPIIKFAYNWNKNMSSTFLAQLFKSLQRLSLRNILIVTKKKLREELEQLIPDTSCVHFNAGRGFNSSSREGGYHLLLMYGRFGFTPLDSTMWNRIGYDSDIIKNMEWSEMMQCIHRGRPLLNPRMPIMLLTDATICPDESRISPKVISLFDKHYDVDTSLSLRKLAEKLKISKSMAKHFRKYSKFIHTFIYGLDQYV